jgi:hypothetical protein
MTTAAPSTALATIQPAFTDPERLALAGFLAGYRGLTKEKSCSASRCCRGVMKTGSLPLGGGCGPGRAGVLRWSEWRWPGRKVHSGGGVPPVVTVHAWTVRGRKRVQLPGPPGG